MITVCCEMSVNKAEMAPAFMEQTPAYSLPN